jgi:hypothetical protein
MNERKKAFHHWDEFLHRMSEITRHIEHQFASLQTTFLPTQFTPGVLFPATK